MRKAVSFFLICFFLLASSFIHSDDPYVIVLLGPPGAGKGTMSARLSQMTGLPHVSVKTLLYEQAKKEGEMNKKLKTYISTGQRVPDDIILEVLKHRIEMSDCKDGFILESFPRTKKQAEILTKTFPNKDRLIFVNICTQDQMVLDRLQGRRLCENCQRRYHIVLNPPKHKGICDDCHGTLITHTKNEASAAEERLKIYKVQYEPIKAFLEPNYQWINVSNDSPDNSFAILIDKINHIDHDLIIPDHQKHIYYE